MVPQLTTAFEHPVDGRPAWGVRIVVDNDPQMAPILLRRRQVEYSLKERRSSVGPHAAEDSQPFSSPAHPFFSE